MERINPLKRFYATIDAGTVESKIKDMPDFPKILEFEVTNHCNFHCIMCKTGLNTALRKRGFMSEETYLKIMDEIAGKDIAIKFVGQGEPLMHPSFPSFLRRAVSGGAVCHLTTNGSYLTEALMDELMDAGLHSIKFSFQGIDAPGFYEMRQSDYFDELMGKIARLYEKRGEREYPYITICTSVTDEPDELIAAFRARYEKICDCVQIGKTTLEFLDIEKIARKNPESAKRLSKLKERQTLHKIRYKCCNQVWDVLTVRWNGDITACCADNDGVMTLGNLSERTIADFWRCDKLNAYRNVLAGLRYEELPLCKDCYDFMGYMSDEAKVSV